MSRVYVTSNRMRKDARTGEIKPAVDLRPAEEYGALAPVFDHTMDPADSADLHRARERLSGFDEDRDFVLPSGSPICTLATGMLLADLGCKFFQVLEWDKFTLKYNMRTIEL